MFNSKAYIDYFKQYIDKEPEVAAELRPDGIRVNASIKWEVSFDIAEEELKKVKPDGPTIEAICAEAAAFAIRKSFINKLKNGKFNNV